MDDSKLPDKGTVPHLPKFKPTTAGKVLGPRLTVVTHLAYSAPPLPVRGCSPKFQIPAGRGQPLEGRRMGVHRHRVNYVNTYWVERPGLLVIQATTHKLTVGVLYVMDAALEVTELPPGGHFVVIPLTGARWYVTADADCEAVVTAYPAADPTPAPAAIDDAAPILPETTG